MGCQTQQMPEKHESRFYCKQSEILPFLSGYRIVPGAGIDDEVDGLGEEPGGATACAVHVVAEG